MIPGVVASQMVQTDGGEASAALAGTITITLTPAANLTADEGAMSGTASFTLTPSGYLGPFAPTDLGSALEGWYDFSDTATITATSNLIDSITDKSGNGNTLAASSTARPGTGVQTLNGFNVATFDGSNDVLSLSSPSGLPSQSATMTLVCLRLFTAGTGGGLIWLSGQTSSFGDVGVLARDGGNMGVWGDNVGSSVGKAAQFADSDNTNWGLSSATHTQTAREIFHNGTSQATNSGSNGTQSVTTLLIGQCLSQNRASNRFFTGRMAEAIILSGTGATNRQKVEGYLMWKYGLQASLPGGHPYASAPP